MPSAVSSNPRAAPTDDLDALFNFDAGIEEAANAPTQTGTAGPEQSASRGNDNSNIDEEIVVTKKRIPIAKLDEDRILSASGIPRLRRISKKMRFKGKGHEFSDMARLLNMYQLWLDDMYPRAKFADGLAMIEKLGHKKRIQLYRKEWIDEGKPRASYPDDEHVAGDETAPDTTGQVTDTVTGDTDTGIRDSDTVPSEAIMSGALQPAESERETAQPRDEEPNGDELDALLAEEEQARQTRPVSKDHDVFAEEEEAMAGLGW